MPLWVVLTLCAAFLQNLRSALQKQLKNAMSTTGATFVRFGFGFPFACLYCAALLGAGYELPEPNATFLASILIGAVAQIAGTFLLVLAFSFRNFMVATAYSKTEPVQAALFGLVILGEAVSGAGLVAIFLGLAGVLTITLAARGTKTGVGALASPQALIGLASGAGFALSAVGVRGAALALGEGPVIMRAAFTLMVATAIQTALMLAFIAIREPQTLRDVARAWRPSLATGLVGVAASAGWFTAMAIQSVAYVRTLGQVELLFTYAAAVFWFRERVTSAELIGCGLIVAAIVTLLQLG